MPSIALALAFFAEAAGSANATEDRPRLLLPRPSSSSLLCPSKSGVDLNKADVVVGAGRGFGAEEDLQMARDLCDKVGGGLGLLRPLAEGFGWLPTGSTLAFPASCSAPRSTSQLAFPARCSTWSAATARPRCSQDQQGPERTCLQAVRLRSGWRHQDCLPALVAAL